MRIELSELDHGRGSFAHVYEPVDLNLEDERVSLIRPAAINGTIRRSGSEVVVTGKVEAVVEVECDRCLTPVQLPINYQFELEYISVRDYESTSVAELTEDLMAVSTFDGESIDVDEIVKEQILLAAPARALCRETCKGICSNCGADLNAGKCGCDNKEVDPRWAALKNLTS